MGTLLEQTRAGHEEMERLERLAVLELAKETKTHKQRLLNTSRVRKMVDGICSRAAKLQRTYADEDRARAEEIASFAGEGNAFKAFDERLSEVRAFHRAHPNLFAPSRVEVDAALTEEPQLDFTGEEVNGRYVDLHLFHRTFVNASFGKRDLDYLAYLDSFARFEGIPRGKKFHEKYSQYLQELFEYLRSFHEKTRPLTFLAPALKGIEERFEAAWDAGEVPGWGDKGVSGAEMPEGTLDLDVFESAEELLTLGPAALKDALSKLGLKCGGTDKQKAERLFSVKGKALSEIDRKLFASGAAPPVSAEQAARQAAKGKEVARLEARVARFAEMLDDVISATKGNTEKKATLSIEELEAEKEDGADDFAVDEDDEEEAAVYNPLKLPLGWDGKPIPYWLYKLHGLNVEFKCEICGNESYWGRRAYERHFREPRHLHGMACLKIPMSKAFLEVTSISDALKLHEALKRRQQGSFKADTDEEFEDGQGNVYSKKLYLDLQKQGLL